jgi:hypothetical protein
VVALPIGVWNDQNVEQRGVEVDLSALVAVHDVPDAFSKLGDRDQVLRAPARDAQTDVRVGHVRA